MHKIDQYIIRLSKDYGLSDKDISLKTGISPSQISKLKNGTVERLTASVFYKLVVAYNSDFLKAINITFPNESFKMNAIVREKRSKLGELLLGFEVRENTLKDISQLTGIKETRLYDLMYRNGAPEAYELILIEKALGKAPGELFEMYFGGNTKSNK